MIKIEDGIVEIKLRMSDFKLAPSGKILYAKPFESFETCIKGANCKLRLGQISFRVTDMQEVMEKQKIRAKRSLQLQLRNAVKAGNYAEVTRCAIELEAMC
jgi:hypothetical protein